MLLEWTFCHQMETKFFSEKKKKVDLCEVSWFLILQIKYCSKQSLHCLTLKLHIFKYSVECTLI